MKTAEQLFTELPPVQSGNGPLEVAITLDELQQLEQDSCNATLKEAIAGCEQSPIPANFRPGVTLCLSRLKALRDKEKE
jgi:hypothetical protein